MGKLGEYPCTDEGGIAVRARVETDIEDTYKLIVEIKDSGSGIPENELNNTNDIVKAFKSGGADYISKPFQAEEVIARVTAHDLRGPL